MRRRRAIILFITGAVLLASLAGAMPRLVMETVDRSSEVQISSAVEQAMAVNALEQLQVKGRAPKTGYSRGQFGDGWATLQGCTTRNIILYRDLTHTVLDDECRVKRGVLQDPYTGEILQFTSEQASFIQIDHVVALSDAWQKGAQALSEDDRIKLANDPLELLAVSGSQNQAKADGDAATWLPKNKAYRCEYIARQIAVKRKYSLWVTEAEKTAMLGVLKSCPDQKLPIP